MTPTQILALINQYIVANGVGGGYVILVGYS